ncbi:MAG: hypothetical protein M5U18_12905 [Dehalococcoidia bacterium]|nr:hypothetical protein [Dehalococcoidia bacterium]
MPGDAAAVVVADAVRVTGGVGVAVALMAAVLVGTVCTTPLSVSFSGGRRTRKSATSDAMTSVSTEPR